MGRPGGRLGEAYGEEVAAVGDVSKDREGIGVRATVLVAMAGVVRKMSDQNSASAKDIALFLRVSWSTHPHHMTGE
jgi:alkyl hydroperoxide reductase subunit AhpC